MTGATAVERGREGSGQARAPRDLRAPGALPPIVFEEPSSRADDPDEPEQVGPSDQSDEPDDADELRAPDLPGGGRGAGGPGAGRGDEPAGSW